MKRITLFCLFILILSSCEKLMHPEETSIGKIENYDMLVSATEGVYGSLAGYMGMGRGYAYGPNMKADDINWFRPNYESYYGAGSSSFISGGLDEEIDWKPLYQIVASANNILSQFEPAANQNVETRKVLGEIYIIRAYCYFRLTRTYGQIPLIDDININYNVTKPSFTEVYDFIEKDLRKAMELLPSNNGSTRIPFVTPHRGTAKAILAETYLSRAGYPCNDSQKYSLAAKEAQELIDSADFFGFGLLDDFANVWDCEHYFNNESEFSLYYSDPSLSINNRTTNQLYRGRRYYPKVPGEHSLNNPLDIQFSCAEGKFYNNFPPSYRKEITFLTTIYVAGYFKIFYPDLDTGTIHITQVDGSTRMAYRKFYICHSEPDLSELDKNGSKFGGLLPYYGISRIYLFRYAQTLLTYAEAMARSGQLNARAYECVNQIRRRANQHDIYFPSPFDLQPGLSAEAFADSVVWERAWELCAEPEGRWFDLIRLEMVEDLPDLRYPKEQGPPIRFNKSEYFFPIPAIDTTLNPNLGDNNK